MKLTDRTALITGAARGIGRALAHAAAARGMHLALGDIDGEALAETADALRNDGARVTHRVCDVRDPAALEALRDAALTELGGIHLLVNNAGVGVAGSILQGHLDDWRSSFEINLYGVLNGLRAIVPAMIAGAAHGHVVNVASLAGVTVNPGFGPYTVAKHGVVTISETLRLELALGGFDKLIGVSVFCPGFIKTHIASASRARGADGVERAPDPLRDAVTDFVDKAVAEGMDVDAAAERVLDAVERGDFWIFTHPRTGGQIRERTDDMLAAADALESAG